MQALNQLPLIAQKLKSSAHIKDINSNAFSNANKLKPYSLVV